MPDRPPFPIPETLEPDTYCLCIQIPNDPIWKAVMVGLLQQPAEWFNWQRDDERSGRVLAHYYRELFNAIDWSTMSCCCDNNDILYQWCPDGTYEESDDGGVSYHPAPQSDPRNPQPKFPPYLPPDTVEPDCTYADSITQMVKTQIVDLLEEGDTYAELIAILISVFTTLMGALAPTVIGSIIVAIMGAICVGIVTASIPAFLAAMTSDVYERFRCNLKSHMQTDGTFTQVNIDEIYATIAEDETGLAMLFLQGFVAAAGVIGLTNAARAGYGAADIECPCGDRLRVYVNNVGIEDDWNGSEISVSPQFAAGYYQVWVQLTNSYVFGDVNYSLCATFDYEVTSGSLDSVAAIWVCPSTSPSDPGLTPISDFCCSLVAFKSTVPFTLDVWAVDCP